MVVVPVSLPPHIPAVHSAAEVATTGTVAGAGLAVNDADEKDVDDDHLA